MRKFQKVTAVMAQERRWAEERERESERERARAGGG